MIPQLEEKSGTITHRLTAETVVADYMSSKLGAARLSSGVAASLCTGPTGQGEQAALGTRVRGDDLIKPSAIELNQTPIV